MDSLSREYCAFTVAIVLVIHPLLSFEVGVQLSPKTLSVEVNNSVYGRSPDFAVNPLALHQGFHIFKKGIRKLGYNLIEMGSKGIPAIVEFMDLPEVVVGWDIIFLDTDRKNVILNSDILLIVTEKAHYLMKQKGFMPQFSSLSHIGAVLWQRQLPTCRPVQITPLETESVQNKRRKSSTEMSDRQRSNCAKKVISMVQSSMCVNNEDPIGYLVAAIKETRNPYDSICKAIFTGKDCDINFDTIYEKVYDDFRVINFVSALPNKYVTFTNEEKMEVIKIFDITHGVLSEIEGRHHDRINYHASLTTKHVLKDLAGYSELVPSSIERWSIDRGKILKKTGRRINSDFEASVWGKLMICEFEKKTVIICTYFSFILHS